LNNKINDTTVGTITSDSIWRAKRALGVIWLTGIVCVIVSVLFIFTSSIPVNNKQHQFTESRRENEDDKSIDQLLLSSDEALLTDKKSFVNGALRFQWQNHEPDLNQGNNRTILYDNILKKKLQRIPKAQVSDFSVKPVPK
jgi:hypothetical protein